MGLYTDCISQRETVNLELQGYVLQNVLVNAARTYSLLDREEDEPAAGASTTGTQSDPPLTALLADLHTLCAEPSGQLACRPTTE
jgi:hypothetical protein